MTTILYAIPDCFFPGYRVIAPFHAKVNYTYKDGNVIINDVTLSDLCLEYIKPKGLSERIKHDIAEAERKKAINPLHPIMQEALAPYINT